MDEKPTNIYREEQKRALRNRVIDTPDDNEDGWQERLRRHRRIYVILGVILVLALIAVVIYWYLRANIREFDDYIVDTSYDLSITGDYDYIPFGENVVYYGRNSATYVNAAGQAGWMKSYEMTNPIADRCGDYLVIADQGGTSILIFDEKGCTGTIADTTIPIDRVSIANQGMVSAILEGDVANYVMFYNKEGAKLNIEMKTLISGNGYPLAFDLSPSGNAMMISYVGVDGDKLKNRIAFYNFEVGQEQVDRLVGGFEHYEDTLIADVHFFDEKHAVAIGDNLLTFFEFETDRKVDIGSEAQIDRKIYDVFYSDQYIGFVFQNTGNENQAPYQVKIYDQNGAVVMDQPVSQAYEEMSIANDQLMIYNNDTLEVYYLTDGVKKITTSLTSNYEIIVPGKTNDTYYTLGPERMQVLKLTK